MGSILLLGLIVGMRHALDADHVAAVATLVTKKQSVAQTIKQGSAWGLGHTLTLFLFGSIVLFMDTVMPDRLAKGLELTVGIMLVLLGIDVLRRVVRDKIHFHSHHHATGDCHFHVHSHAGENHDQHAKSRHDHHHPQGFPLRALLIGLVHGMAGSAAIILLALETVTSPLRGLLYILTFGIGSMLGMAALSVIISLPIRMSAKRLTGSYNLLQALIGTLTIALGMAVVFENHAFLLV